MALARLWRAVVVSLCAALAGIAVSKIDLGGFKSAEDAHAAGAAQTLRVGIAFQRRQTEEGMTYLRRCVAYRERELADACVSQAVALRDDGTPPTFEESARIEAARREMDTRTMDWSTLFSN